MQKIILLTLLLTLTYCGFAQDEKPCQEIDNEKAVKAYKEGINKKNKKEERLDYLQQALKLEPDYVDANFAFAEEKIKTFVTANTSFKPTEPYFKKVIEICPKYHSDPYYYLGFIYYEDEKWDSCLKYLKLFIAYKSDDDSKFNKSYPAYISQANEMVRYAKSFDELMNHPVPYEPQLVEDLCTDKNEYLAMISPDDETMYFTRNMPFIGRGNIVGEITDKDLEMFCAAKRSDKTGKFSKGAPMPPPFNTYPNQGGATLTIDNKHMYLTICRDEKRMQINCDIYYSDFIDGEWTPAKKVPGINDSIRWDAQATIASDGKTLYFASDRRGGYGGVDIYVTVHDEVTGTWSKPENLGKTINTNGDEKTPFIHSDFQTLYFSSTGQPGVGGFDIFYSKKNDKGNWIEPKNIGVPINTTGDDLGFFVSTDGHLGYFCSNQPSRAKNKYKGGYDVYDFELYKEARPDEVAFFKGKVESKANDESKNYTVEVKDAVTKKVTKAMVDTTTGEYAVVVNVKEKHAQLITVKKNNPKDNLAFSSKLVLPDSIKSSKPVTMNVVTDTIKAGQTYPLNDLYYPTNSSVLDPRSVIVLEEFIDFLKAHPQIKIEIHGHTDNVGNDKSNLALSTDRAFTVRDILLVKGIAESRLIAFKGFGSSQPIADNSTAEGRKKNRRTEFVIVEK